MMPHMYNAKPAIQTRFVKSRDLDLPSCDALRACAVLILLMRHVIPLGFSDLGDFDLVARLGFALSGFLMTGYLLRARDGISDSLAGKGRKVHKSWIGSIQRIVPLPYALMAVAAALYLPATRVLAGSEGSALPNLLAWLDRIVAGFLAYFGRLSFEGWFWTVWPFAALLAPRRVFKPLFIATLSSGPMNHFWSLSAADVHPASLLLAPSAFDLLAAGAFLGMIYHRGDTGQGGRFVRMLSTVLAILVALVGFHYWDHWKRFGSVTFFHAPAGFGIANFLLELSATMLVASCSWQYVPRRIGRIERSPAA